MADFKRGYMTTKQEAAQALDYLEAFMPVSQFRAIRHNFFGEEKQHFYNKSVELADRIKSMPVTYKQDGKGNQATAHIHYFNHAFDWYITEKDIEQEQRQAFGLADMGSPEIGYISIIELIQNGAELDLYFEPKTLEEIQGA